MSTFRITCGQWPAPSGSTYRLALRIADYAKSIGMSLRILRRSRSAGSKSCYLTLVDEDNLPWIVRVSDHRRSDKTPESAHHIDYVSKDGQSGFEQVVSVLHRIVQGDFEWHDTHPETLSEPER